MLNKLISLEIEKFIQNLKSNVSSLQKNLEKSPKDQTIINNIEYLQNVIKDTAIKGQFFIDNNFEQMNQIINFILSKKYTYSKFVSLGFEFIQEFSYAKIKITVYHSGYTITLIPNLDNDIDPNIKTILENLKINPNEKNVDFILKSIPNLSSTLEIDYFDSSLSLFEDRAKSKIINDSFVNQYYLYLPERK